MVNHSFLFVWWLVVGTFSVSAKIAVFRNENLRKTERRWIQLVGSTWSQDQYWLPGQKLGGGSKYFYFHPYLRKIPILHWYFSKGLKPPTRKFGFQFQVFFPYRHQPSSCQRVKIGCIITQTKSIVFLGSMKPFSEGFTRIPRVWVGCFCCGEKNDLFFWLRSPPKKMGCVCVCVCFFWGAKNKYIKLASLKWRNTIYIDLNKLLGDEYLVGTKTIWAFPKIGVLPNHPF